MQIRKIINTCHDPAAVGLIFQIKQNSVYLIEQSFFVLMFDPQLIAVSFADRTVLISPCIPDLAVKISDIVGFLDPNP